MKKKAVNQNKIKAMHKMLVVSMNARLNYEVPDFALKTTDTGG